MANKSVSQHLADSKALAQTIADANALVIKLQAELQLARQTLETLGEWSHPKLVIGPLYGPLFRDGDAKNLTGQTICKMSVARINEVLGDRA